MTFKELKNQIKQELKEQVQIIRRGKFLRKPKNRTNTTKEDYSLYFHKAYGGGMWFDFWKVKDISNEYRHKHIAYCHFFNGTEYGLIENPRRGNERKQSLIDAYIKSWESKIDEEVVRRCA